MFDSLTHPLAGVKMKRIHPAAIPPKVATPGSAAVDLYSVETVIAPPNTPIPVGIGWAMELPDPRLYFSIVPRSGRAFKENLTVANSPATIDFDYRGEIKVLLFNRSNTPLMIYAGERIAQMIIGITLTSTLEFEEVSELSDTLRGTGGFGSTGKV